MSEIKDEDRIEIINRSTSHLVSKSLICSKSEYFNRAPSLIKNFHVNFDEVCLKSIIGWLHSNYVFINMENVLPMHYVSCQLAIDPVKNDCCSFFNENFTAKLIPTLIKHVKDDTPLLNFSMFNSFLSKNFLRLINGEYFLEFPLEVVKYILSLDLVIESEFQVFQAIVKWLKHDQFRITHLPELIRCIRWCHTFKNCYSKIKETDFVAKNLPNLDELTCEPGECKNCCFNSRVRDKHLISIYSCGEKLIGISYYIGENCWEPCGSFEEDDKIPVDLITDGHVSDFIFNSGRTGLRIDFVNKKFRWLEMSGSSSAYYSQLYNCFMPTFDRESSYRAYIQDGVRKIDPWIDLEKNTLIEDKGVMNIICYPKKDCKLYVFLPVEHCNWYNLPFDDLRIHAIVLNDMYYILTGKMSFRVFDNVKKTVEKTKPFESMNLSFDDVLLDSFKSDVLLLIKSQKKIMRYDTRKKIWSLMGQIYSSNEMIALTETYIPVQFIKKL